MYCRNEGTKTETIGQLFLAEVGLFRVMTDGRLWAVRWRRPVNLRRFKRSQGQGIGRGAHMDVEVILHAGRKGRNVKKEDCNSRDMVWNKSE
jgi:hypothetical protein